jgi:hypothetical protein
MLSLVAAVVYYAFVVVGTMKGGALGVSVGVTVWLFIFGPIQLLVASRPGGGTLRDVGRVYFAPLAVASVAVGAGIWLGSRLPATLPARAWAQCVVVTAVTLLLYVPAIRLVAPADWAELVGQLRRIIGGRLARMFARSA